MASSTQPAVAIAPHRNAIPIASTEENRGSPSAHATPLATQQSAGQPLPIWRSRCTSDPPDPAGIFSEGGEVIKLI